MSIEADSERVDKLLSELEGKSIEEVISAGVSKLASVPAGGGGGGGGGAAAGGGGGGAGQCCRCSMAVALICTTTLHQQWLHSVHVIVSLLHGNVYLQQAAGTMLLVSNILYTLQSIADFWSSADLNIGSL